MTPTRARLHMRTAGLIAVVVLVLGVLVPPSATAQVDPSPAEPPPAEMMPGRQFLRPEIPQVPHPLYQPGGAILGPPLPATLPTNGLVAEPAAFRDPDGFYTVESHPILPYTLLSLPIDNSFWLLGSASSNLLAEVSIPGEPTAIAFSPDGEYVYFASRNSPRIMRFAFGHFLATGEELPILDLPTSEIPRDLAVGADGRIFMLGADGIHQLDPVTGASVGAKTGSIAGVFVRNGEIDINREGTRLYYGDHGISPASLYEIDVSVEPPVVLAETPHVGSGSNGQDLELSLDGSVLAYATGSGQGNYEIARYLTNGLTIDGSWNVGAYPQAVAFSPDGLYVYTANTRGSVDVWETKAPYAKLGTFALNDADATAVEIHADLTGVNIYVLADNGIVYPIGTGNVREGVIWCFGMAVTVNMSLGQKPTSAIDVIYGTDSADVLRSGGGTVNVFCGEGGDDTILGGDGFDLADGGDGDDKLRGMGGEDSLYGGTGRDQIWGGPGDDFLSGNEAVDRLRGEAGDDTMYGGGGSDRMWGGPGADEILAGSGADRVWGGDGDDDISGMGGKDFLWGQMGNDIIQGSHQSDEIAGGEGDDTLRGAGGKDTIVGGNGNDQLFGGNNSDDLNGDAGDDSHDGQRGRDECHRDTAGPGDTFMRC